MVQLGCEKIFRFSPPGACWNSSSILQGKCQLKILQLTWSLLKLIVVMYIWWPLIVNPGAHPVVGESACPVTNFAGHTNLMSHEAEQQPMMNVPCCRHGDPKPSLQAHLSTEFPERSTNVPGARNGGPALERPRAQSIHEAPHRVVQETLRKGGQIDW